jgi:conjugal transfer mating pair stabilization protein TraN
MKGLGMLQRLGRMAIALSVASLGAGSALANSNITPSQAASAGKTLGTALNPVHAGRINQTVRGQVVPPPNGPRDCVADQASTEAHYGGGNGNLPAAAGPLMMSAPSGTSPECSAINTMQGRASTVNPITISPTNPAVVNAKNIGNNPGPSLGTIGGIFINPPPTSTCQPGSVTSGSGGHTEQCYEYADLESGICERKVDFQIEKWFDYQCVASTSQLANPTCTREWAVEVNTVPGSCVEGAVLFRNYYPYDVNASQSFNGKAGGGVLEIVCRNAEPKGFTLKFGGPDYSQSVNPDLTGWSLANATEYSVSSSSPQVLRDYPSFAEDWDIWLEPSGSCSGSPEVCNVLIMRRRYDWTNIRGGGSIPVTRPNSVVRTITRDELVDGCLAHSSIPTCTPAGKVCIEGVNETRVINGLPVTKACWKEQQTYECSSQGPAGSCAPLAAEPRCTQISSGTCLSWAINGSCTSWGATQRCTTDMGSLPGVTEIGTGYNIIKDDIDASLCAARAASPNCTKISSVCVDTADKTFFGFTFTKACWKWEDKYSCAVNPNLQSCTTLQNQGCTFIPNSTACTHLLPDGTCGVRSHMYQCGQPATTTPTGSTCDAIPYCINGVCYDQVRPGDPDFGKAVAGMETLRHAGVYMDPDTLKIFQGEPADCRRKIFGLTNCCKAEGGTTTGNTFRNSVMYAAFEFGKQFVGSKYAYDALNGASSAVGSALSSMGVLNASTEAPTTFNVYGFQFGFANGSFSYVGFDPVSFATAIAIQLILTEITSCPKEDQKTAMRRAQGLCHHVGDYCSRKVLGACYTKKESYCCFNSKLAKAITVDGKRQLNMSFGHPRSPDCTGLTVEQVSGLDFSQIDMSEFIASIEHTPMASAEAQANVANRLTNYAPVAPVYNQSPPVQAPPSIPKPPPPPVLPDPTVTVAFNPNPVRQGQPFTVSTQTLNADSLEYDCTGFMPMAGTLPIGNIVTNLVAPTTGWGETICMVTVKNEQVEVVTQHSFMVLPPAPTVSGQFTPSSVIPGDSYQFSSLTQNADELTYACSGSRVTSGSLPVGSQTAGPWIAAISEIGTTNCVLTARFIPTGETATANVSQVIGDLVPWVNASFSPGSVTAGTNAVLVTSSLRAVSLTYSCTGALTNAGSVGSVANDSTVMATSLANVGNAVCRVTATSQTGRKAEVFVTLNITAP